MKIRLNKPNIQGINQAIHPRPQAVPQLTGLLIRFLVVVCGRQRRGFEIKRTTTPAVMPSMRHALADLKLDRIDVIHAGGQTFPLADHIRAVAAVDLERVIEPLA